MYLIGKLITTRNKISRHRNNKYQHINIYIYNDKMMVMVPNYEPLEPIFTTTNSNNADYTLPLTNTGIILHTIVVVC